MAMKPKKVAILTTHRANNFGAMLQAYSLVMACREEGMDAEILDWRNPYYEWLYHRPVWMGRHPLRVLRRAIVFFGLEKSARKAFATFRASLPMSRKITSRRHLARIESMYDSFIVGSDQVWNPINSAKRPEKFDRANLLDFVKAKSKNAYAASIGVKEIKPDSLLPEFVAAWKTFDVITTREHAGAEYVARMSGHPATAVVDPVLLHDADFWNLIAKGVMRKKYVLLYNVKRSLPLMTYAEALAKELNLELVTIRIPAHPPLEAGTMVSAGPAEFLSYIRDAECVITNSFHASAFAVIFGKKLYIEQGTNVQSANSRISSLMKYAGLEPKPLATLARSWVSFADCSSFDRKLLCSEIERSRTYLKAIAAGEKTL